MRVPSENVCLADILSRDSTRDFILKAVRRHSRGIGCQLRPDEVEDVAQETLLRLWQAPRTIRPTQLRAYLAQSARSVLVDRLRAANAAKRRESKQKISTDVALVASADPSADEHLALRQEFKERMRSIASVLSPQMMVVLRLVFCAGLTAEEAASHLNVSHSAIESAVHRARTRLASKLGISLVDRRSLRKERHHAHP